MSDMLKQKLVWRLVSLGILALCLNVLLRNSATEPLASTTLTPSPIRIQAPIVKAQLQDGAPLVISFPRTLSWDGPEIELAFDLINVSGKTIRAYAIKQQGGETNTASSITLHNLELTNSELLANQSVMDFDTYQFSSGQGRLLTLSVDFVEFSDETRWGEDSGKSAERTAGQRAALKIVSKRLLKIMNTSNAADVCKAIEDGETNIDPPEGQSAEWKDGFRQGRRSLAARLMNAKKKGGLDQVERELRRFAARFDGGQ